jgi:hypothetical protein
MFLHVVLKVRYGKIDRFSEIFARMLPVLEREGWQMVGAFQALIGNYTTVIHVWRIREPNHHPAALQAAFADEGFAAAIAELGEVVLDETVQVMVPTSYSPA